MKRQTHRPAFTLLELLVVIGIIIALLALLLPMMTTVRESGRRTQCLSRLRSLTTAWLAYANDNEGRLCSSDPGTHYDTQHHVQFFWSWIDRPAVDPPVGGLGIHANIGEYSRKEGKLWPYLKDESTYRCPADSISPERNASSYQANGVLAGTVGTPYPRLKLEEIAEAPKTFVFIEGCSPAGTVISCFGTPIHPANSFTLPAPLPPPGAVITVLPKTGWPGENHQDSSGKGVGTGISFADGHAIFWKYSDPRTGRLVAMWQQGSPSSANSPDVYQLEAWSGGPVPPGVDQ